jgi:hypothetical protein
MRKVLSCLIAIGIAFSASAQFSVGAGATYTHFYGNFKKSTPGFQTRLLYEKGLYGAGISYIYHSPFDVKSYVNANTGLQYVESNISFRFHTVDLFVRRVILGSEDSKGKFYGGLGASLVLAKYKETPKEPITFMPDFPLENSQYRTINLNGIIGGEYNLGRVSVFGEAFYYIPTRERVRRNMESYIITAARLGFQLGLKLPLNYP